jgi:sarcosine oxidase subunit beta
MRRIYDVVIVGGGVQGLSLAYNLAKGGMRNVAVLEKSHIGCGASTRNGEMLRSAFAHEAWLSFFNESLRIWESLSSELEFNLMFTRCGYLVLASSPERMEGCRRAFERQKAFGLNSCLLEADEVRRLIPALNPSMAVGGIFQPNGGFARHDAVIWAYANAGRRLGIEIIEFTEVIGIDVKDGAVTGVRTSRGNIETPKVVNAAGGHSSRVAAMAGIDLPAKTYRLEMIATEPIKPFLRQNLATLDLLGYMHQTTRGEFVGGTESPEPQPCMRLRSTLAGLRDMANKFVTLFPGLAGVRVMRQWAGLLHQAPDASPILGPVWQVKGFIMDCGWTYGFLGSPAAGKLVAEYILSGEMPSLIQPFSPERFETGEFIIDTSMVISTEAEKAGES